MLEEWKKDQPALEQILAAIVGGGRAARLSSLLVVHPELSTARQPTQAVVAQALNMLLFEDLLRRVPAAAAYVADCEQKGEPILHDHGAVRTVLLDGMGGLPAGQETLIRLLRPLGYKLQGTYPLDRLKMMGRSWAQRDYPEDIAQFFVSELFPDRFSPDFQQAVLRVTRSSRDPLTPEAQRQLLALEVNGELPLEEAARLLPVLVSCFDRQHSAPALADYEVLLAESPEMAWIATEGNAFNHATARVLDVDELAREQKALGRPMKPEVEVSASRRVRQTAFLAARVQREFVLTDGRTEQREVNGSFYEFITRMPLPEVVEGRHPLDLGFDSSNAQAIFKMTANTK